MNRGVLNTLLVCIQLLLSLHIKREYGKILKREISNSNSFQVLPVFFKNTNMASSFSSVVANAITNFDYSVLNRSIF